MTREEIERALANPDTRDVLINNMRNQSNNGALAVAPDEFDVRAQQEIGLAKKSISAFGEAERGESFERIEESAQRRGVLTGGSATRELRESSEEFDLRQIGLLSEAERDILARHGGFRQEQELQTERLGSAETLQGRQITSTEALQQRAITSAEFQQGEQITSTEALTREGFESAEDIAIISGKFAVEASRGAGVEAATVSAQSRMDVLLADQAFYTYEGTPSWLKDFDLKESTLLTVDPTTGKQVPWAQLQFQQNFDLLKDSTLTTDEDGNTIPFSYKQFKENATYLYDQLKVTENKNRWTANLAISTLQETIRQGNMLDSRERENLQLTLDAAESEGLLNRENILLIQREAVAGAIKQTGMNNSTAVGIAVLNAFESGRQFDLSRSDQIQFVIEELSIARESMTNSKAIASLNIALAYLNSGAGTDPERMDVGIEIYEAITGEPPGSSEFNYVEDQDFDYERIFKNLVDKGMDPSQVAIYLGQQNITARIFSGS